MSIICWTFWGKKCKKWQTIFGSKVEYAEGKERIVSTSKQSVHVRPRPLVACLFIMVDRRHKASDKLMGSKSRLYRYDYPMSQ